MQILVLQLFILVPNITCGKQTYCLVLITNEAISNPFILTKNNLLFDGVLSIGFCLMYPPVTFKYDHKLFMNVNYFYIN